MVDACSQYPKSCQIDLVVLAAGRGSRFQDISDSNLPKPMIKIAGHPFFYWATVSITKQIRVARIIFAVLESDVKNYQIDDEIHNYFPASEIVVIPIVQNGPANTAAIVIEETKSPNSIIIADCDQAFYEVNLQSFLTEFVLDSRCLGAVGIIESTNPNHGFVVVDRDSKLTSAKASIDDSSTAFSGIYVFRNQEIFISTLNTVQSYISTKQECVLADIIAGLIKLGFLIHAWPISHHLAFGTPSEYLMVQNSKIFEMLA